MLLIIGFFIVMASTLGGFMLAGGNPLVLLHLSEFVVIGGIALGILVISSPASVLSGTMKWIIASFKGGTKSEEYIDLLKLLYEMFLLGRRNGLIALDEHVSSPAESPLFQKYPSFVNKHERVEFLCNSLRPLIDGKVKPEQLEKMLETEVEHMEDEAHGPLSVINLVGDSLPGVGIVAAVLGIINTMGAIAEGPEKVGYKVAAALTGTFLGIFGAYGFINPLHKRIAFLSESEVTYYQIISQAVSGFAKGLAPIMAIEIARRSMERSIQPEAEELETMLKALNKQG